MQPIQIIKPCVLLVEGKDDRLFFEALNEHLGFHNIQVLDYEGKTNFRPFLKVLTKTPGFIMVSSLGITRDADMNGHTAFQSVCDALQSIKLPVPDRPLMRAGQNPRVSIMILPQESTSGMLEDLCLKAVMSDPAISCMEKYFQCLIENGLTLPNNQSKAKVQVFLASRPEAGKRLGEAAAAGYLPWENDAFEQVKNFIRQIGS